MGYREISANRKRLRRALIGLGGATLLIAVLSAGGYLWLNGSSGRSWLAGELEDILAGVSGRAEIARLEGRPLSAFRVIGLSLQDDEGEWLTAREITVRWRPLGLLGGRVKIESLDAEAVSLRRIPAATEPRPNRPGEGAGWAPRAFRLDSLEVRLQTPLGAPASGKPLSYVLTGREIDIAADRLRLSALLAAAASDGDNLALEADWKRGEEALTLDARLLGAAGGVLESLLGLSGQGPVEAEIVGDGPIASWRGRAAFGLGSGWRLEAELAGQGTSRLGLSGTLSYPAARAAPWDRLVGRKARLSGALELSRLLRPLIDLEADLPGGTLAVEGRLNPEDGALFDRLSFDLAVPRLAFASGDGERIEIAAFAVSGRLGGSPAAFSLEGTYRFESAAGLGAALAASGGDLSLEVDPARLDFEVRGEGTRFGQSLAAGNVLESAAARWDLAGEINRAQDEVSLELRELSLDWLSLAGEGDFGQKRKEVALVGTIEGDALMRALEIAGTKGRIDFRLDFGQSAGLPGLVQLTGTVADFKSGLDRIDGLVGSAPAFELRGETQTGVGLRVERARIEGAGIDFLVRGRVSPSGLLALDYWADFDSLAGSLPGQIVLEGGLRVTGALADDFQNPSLSAATAFEKIDLWGLAAQKVDVRLSLQSLFAQPSGEIAIEGKTAAGRLAATSRISGRENGDLAFEEISADLSAIAVTGDLTRLAAGGLEGRLDGRLASGELTLAGRGLAGEGTFGLTLARVEGNQEIGFRSDLGNIRLRGASGRTEQIEKLVGAGRLLLAEIPRGEIDLVLEKYYRGALALDRLSLSGTLGEDSQLEADAAGHYYEPFELRGSARLAADRAGAQRLVLDFAADYGGRPVGTEQPIALSIGKDGFEADFPAVRIGEGRLAGTLESTPEVLAGEARAQGIDAVLLGLPWPGILSSGTISGTARFDIGRGREVLALDLEGADLQFVRLAGTGIEPYAFSFALEAADGRLEAGGSVSAEGAEVGRLDAGFEYRRDPRFAILPEAPVTFELSWDGPAAPLWSFARLEDHDIQGRLRGTIGIAGTISAPEVTGNVALSGGGYRYLPSGLGLTDLSLAVTGAGDRLTISAFEARGTDGGRLRAEGAFTLSPELFFPGTLSIEAENLKFVDLERIDAAAGGGLVYKRREDGASLAGEVTTTEIEAAISQRLPKSVVSIEVTEINRPAEAESPARRIAQRPPLELDLAVTIPNRFFVRGRGLESEWKGRLDIAGTSTAPRIAGGLSLVRGSFDFAGKRFTLDRGSLGFDGGREIDPEIELVSTTRTATIDARIAISGPLSSPQVTMSSVPALPDDEILAQLLFGKSLSELGPLELAELASALSSLSGGGGFNVIGATRKGIGLDLLSIGSDPESEGGALITGGKYLTPKVYLEVETATATGDTITRLYYDIAKRWRAESEVGQRKGSSLKIKWFWDY